MFPSMFNVKLFIKTHPACAAQINYLLTKNSIFHHFMYLKRSSTIHKLFMNQTTRIAETMFDVLWNKTGQKLKLIAVNLIIN